MILIKLGGSVITRKTGFKEFEEGVTRRLAREIASSGKRVFIVHGAGSFGHVLAHKHSLQNGFQNEGQREGLAQVMADVRELNVRVIEALNREGVPSASIPPGAVGELDNGRLIALDTQAFSRFSRIGLTPVTFGDVCTDRSRGFGICSGDQLMEWLTREFSPEKVIFCADVDGVFTSDPCTDPEAELIPLVTRTTLEGLPRTERCLDVTGSIFAKLESMLRLASSSECLIINGRVEGRLRSALLGQEVIGSRALCGD